MEQENAAPAAKKKSSLGLIIGLCVGVVAIIGAIIAVILIMANGGDPVIGKYSIYSYVDKDGNESTQEVALVKAFGANIYIEFKKDGKGELVTDYSGSSFFTNSEEGSSSETEAKQTLNFNWKDGKITDMEQEEGAEKKGGTYKLSDDKKYVTISIDGQDDEKSLKFERVEEEKK